MKVNYFIQKFEDGFDNWWHRKVKFVCFVKSGYKRNSYTKTCVNTPKTGYRRNRKYKHFPTGMLGNSYKMKKNQTIVSIFW